MILLGNPYTIKDGSVYWNGQRVSKADPETFQHLGGDWGRDAQQIFVQATLKKIDAATSQYLNPVFVKDAHQVYDCEGAIKGADPQTFEVLDPGVSISEEIATKAYARGYARDANAVYYHDQMFGRAAAVRGADPATFVSLRNDFGVSGKGVWHQKSKLPKADPKTWVYLGRLWSMDGERVYYAEREVADLDRKRFTVVHAPTIENLASDGIRFFDADRPLEEQDFWRLVSENFAAFEQWFRVAYGQVRSR